jgi:hypothetical protein
VAGNAEEEIGPDRYLKLSPGRRLLVTSLALVLATAAFFGLWRAFRLASVDESGDEADQEPIDLQPRVTAVVPVGPYPTDIAVGEGAVWVAVPAQQPEQDNLVVRVDPVTNEVVARIRVGAYLEEVAAGAGGVWGAGIEWTGRDPSFHVVRIDPATNQVAARIPDVSGPLAVGHGALWGVDRAGARAGPDGSSLLRVDPATNQVSSRIPLGVPAWDVEAGEGYVWVLPMEPEPGEGDLIQVDPVTNEIVARIEMPLPATGYPPTVFAPAVGDESAWVPVCCPDNELMLYRVDVGTGRVVGDPITVPGGAPFAVAAGHVWVIKEEGALYGLSVATFDVDEAVSGFDWPAGGFPDPSTELDPDDLAAWVANSDQGTVTRVDLAARATPSPQPEPPSVATFQPNEGWNLVQTTIDPTGSQDPPIVWAANVPFSPDDSASGFPSNTIRELPEDGIVITVVGPRRYAGDTFFPPAAFPLTISQGFCAHDRYETQPAPHVSRCLVDTMVGDELLNVSVWFGTNVPSDEMYRRANAQLAHLVMPRT